MNSTLHGSMKAEALRRMRLIRLREDFIRDFEDEGEIHICTFQGTFRDPSAMDKAMVRSFERENNALVYLILRVRTIKGDMDSLLYVDGNTEEWQMHMEDLKAGCPLSYTVVHYDASRSEFGCIAIRRTKEGGIIRVG